MSDRLDDTLRDFKRIDVDPVLVDPEQIYRRAHRRTVRSRVALGAAAVVLVAGGVTGYSAIAGEMINTAPAQVADQPSAIEEPAFTPSPAPSGRVSSAPVVPQPDPRPVDVRPEPTSTPSTPAPTSAPTPKNVLPVDFLLTPANLPAAMQPAAIEKQDLALKRRAMALAGCKPGATLPPSVWRSIRQNVGLGSYVEQYVIPYATEAEATAAVEAMMTTAMNCPVLDTGEGSEDFPTDERILSILRVEREHPGGLLWMREGRRVADRDGQVVEENDPQADFTVIRAGSTVIIGMAGKHHDYGTEDLARVDKAIRALACDRLRRC